MIIKKMIALLLCSLLLLSVIFACDSPDNDDPVEIDDVLVVDDPEPDDLTFDTPFDGLPSGGIDFEAAISAFPPDTVMIRSGDIIFTWADLYVFLFRAVQDVMQFAFAGIDWDEEFGDDVTLADIVMNYSTEEALTFLLFEHGAATLDLSISDDDTLELSELLDEMTDYYGGREELAQFLRENSGFYSLEVFERLLLVEFTRDLILVELYGEDADYLEEDKVVDYAERNEFMMAKHILVLSEDNDNAQEEAEDILKQLNARVSDNDFEDFFDDLMQELSDDPGKISNPEGYLFQFEDMVTPFSSACAALEIGQLSDIVESDFGYHIILRLPVNFDSVPSSAARTGSLRTLRQLAAIDDFEGVVEEWREELNPEFSSDFNSIDLSTIFQWRAD